MIYLNSFILCGSICLIGQVLLDNTKLTPGHITTIFVIIGAILSFLNIYTKLNDYSLIGSSLPITSFGNNLYQSSLEGYTNNGIIGIFSNIFNNTSAGISMTIFSSFIFSCIFRPKK